MFSRMTEYDRTFDVLDELRRQMDRVWNDFDGTWGAAPAPSQGLTTAAWPRIDVHDAGANVLVSADVPGLSEKEIDVSLEDGVLTIRGERKPEPAEGYTVHRRERAALRFARAVALPMKVDPERTTAAVRDGVLTITLAKAPEARPRQIAVRSQA